MKTLIKILCLSVLWFSCEDGLTFIGGAGGDFEYYECQCPEGDTVWDDCEEETYDDAMDCFDDCEMLGGYCECIGEYC